MQTKSISRQTFYQCHEMNSIERLEEKTKIDSSVKYVTIIVTQTWTANAKFEIECWKKYQS